MLPSRELINENLTGVATPEIKDGFTVAVLNIDKWFMFVSILTAYANGELVHKDEVKRG